MFLPANFAVTHPNFKFCLPIGYMLALLACFQSAAVQAQDPPTELSGSVSNNIATLVWTEAPDAVAYNVYRDNAYITTVSNNEYSESFPEGTIASYYVVAFSAPPRQFSVASERLTLPASAVPDDTTIPPSVPTNLSGEIIDTVVSLQWDASTDDEAVAGYNVYENNNYVDTVFSTQWQGSVEADSQYRYAIVAFDIRNNFSAQSSALQLPESAVPPDTMSPPSQVTGLSGSLSGGVAGNVQLSWDPAIDDQEVAGYNVYEDNRYQSTVYDTQYSAETDASGIRSYYIVAFDFDGNFGIPSETLILPEDTAPEEDSEPPSVPGSPSAQISGNNEILLTWSASSDNRLVTGYNVYENENYLTTVFTTRFVKPVEGTGDYTYYIVAFDAAGNFSSRSNQASVSATDNRAPFFPNLPDVIMAAGDDLALIIAPEDTDGPVPGLFIGNLPNGMSSVDNFNGTRSLLWSPLQPDVGVYEIFVTAIDALDPGLQTTESFLLTVELPDDPSTIENLPPGIDQIGPQVVRTGDTVIMEVKATDPNGTIPMLSILNLPEGATFIAHPEFANVSVLRWTTSIADLGINTLNFRAVDNVDNNLQFNSSVILEVKEPEDFVRPGVRLKTLAQARNLDIGYASLLQFFNRPDTDLYQSIASEEFNLVTAENSMKWGYINPEPGEYRFDAADGLIRFADEHDMKVHGHTLVWYASLPQWVQQSVVSERESLMYNFIDTLTTRYSSVAIWDVVNEAFEEDGTYRNSVWFEAMGKEHVHKAFIRARANAPTARLIYNDYNISYAGPKSDAVFDLLQELLEQDIPVDGVGFQMHLDTRFTAIDSVVERMAAFAALGLEIYITELDVSILDGDNEQDQAELYAAITEACLAQTACKALQMWGFTDRYSWRAEFNPLVLDRNYQAKPAYLAMQEALE